LIEKALEDDESELLSTRIIVDNKSNLMTFQKIIDFLYKNENTWLKRQFKKKDCSLNFHVYLN
jgi:predicted transcriptional regulator